MLTVNILLWMVLAKLVIPIAELVQHQQQIVFLVLLQRLYKITLVFQIAQLISFKILLIMFAKVVLQIVNNVQVPLQISVQPVTLEDISQTALVLLVIQVARLVRRLLLLVLHVSLLF